MAHKQIIYLTVGTVVLALAVMTFGKWPQRPAPATANFSASPTAPSPDALVAPTANPTAQASNEEPGVPPLPPNATHVPDDYLVKLSAMVHLTNADEHRIDKERWARALPIAERLAQAPCDCEQRNWLNHFISMGQSALEGLDEDYYRTAVLMQKMARNDQQLADHPEFFAR